MLLLNKWIKKKTRERDPILSFEIKKIFFQKSKFPAWIVTFSYSFKLFGKVFKKEQVCSFQYTKNPHQAFTWTNNTPAFYQYNARKEKLSTLHKALFNKLTEAQKKLEKDMFVFHERANFPKVTNERFDFEDLKNNDFFFVSFNIENFSTPLVAKIALKDFKWMMIELIDNSHHRFSKEQFFKEFTEYPSLSWRDEVFCQIINKAEKHEFFRLRALYAKRLYIDEKFETRRLF